MPPEVARRSLGQDEQQVPPLAPVASLQPISEPGASMLSPGWPLKLPLDLAFMVMLAASLWLPSLLSSANSAITLGIVAAPAVVAAFALRVVFEAMIVRLGRQPLGPRIMAASLVTAALGAAVAGTLSVVLGAYGSLFGLVATATLVAATTGSAALVRSAEGRIGLSNRRVFFVGSNDQYLDLAREAARRGDVRVVGRMTLGETRSGVQAQVVERVAAAHATTLVLSAESIGDDRLVSIASELHLRGLRVRTLSDFYEQHFAKIPVSDLSKAWFLFDVAEIHRARVYGVLKRVVEGAVSGTLLVLSLPLLPALAACVRLSGPGPILHRNVRIGKDGRIIRLTKFRTMTLTDDAEQLWATDSSSRITRVGRFLRRYRLDEIPQLWHVLRGDLSLVGPRPEQPQIVHHLQDRIEFYAARHCVRPGITGWAQVNHGYAGSVEDTIEKLQYEFFYIKRQSLAFDLVILLATIRTIIAGGGQ